MSMHEMPDYVNFLKRFSMPIAIDTEGSQIRTGNLGTEIILKVMISKFIDAIECNQQQIFTLGGCPILKDRRFNIHRFQCMLAES